MAERKLATIQKILNVEPIEGADRILLATTLGWKCIVSKDDNLKVGDLCCYIEIDSLCPAIPLFSFLEKRKYKVKTLKMRKSISQGLIIPLSKLESFNLKNIKEGMDVTDILGIKKIDEYEPEENQSTKKHNWLHKKLLRLALYRWLHKIMTAQKKGWPEDMPHTDEERIQSCYYNLKTALDNPMKTWYISTKMDGQSGSYYTRKGLIKRFYGQYSRTLRKRFGDGSNWDIIERKYSIRKILKDHGKNIYIQGEICGPKIQKNKDGFKELDFFVFNIFDLDRKEFYSVHNMIKFCEKYKLKTVPIIDFKSLVGRSVDDLVELSKGVSSFNPEALREGIVIRENNNVQRNRISFKVINPEFLIKYGC